MRRDALAGTITGLVAIPLTVGICMMSEYPIQTGLATVIFACIIGFLASFFRPGNHIGVPGVAAGLAPVLAMGIHNFGFENMPFLILMASAMQAMVWKYKLEVYILKIVPSYLIEGLLAGVGLRIAVKFLPYTYDIVNEGEVFWTDDRVRMVMISSVALMLFLYLYKRYSKTFPGLPYLLVIAGSVWLSFHIELPMLEIDHVPFEIAIPMPTGEAVKPLILAEMILYAAMLALIDIIEQVMSNAAIEKIDPYQRKSDSNNSLFAIWLANLAASFFGGMTNLDGLAKSSTNRMAGAVSKLSLLFVAGVLGITLAYPQLLTALPEFSLAVLMIFTGWKMIAGLYHVALHGKYAFGISMFCGILVFQLGIFEGLIITLALHSFIAYIIHRHHDTPTLEILRKFISAFSDRVHPHATEHMEVNSDPDTGGLTYTTVENHSAEKKSLSQFICDWETGINSHNVLNVVGTYDVSGLLWGTFAKDLRVGHFHIKRYFEHLFELDRVIVHFDSAEVRQYNDIFIQSGAYSFSFFKKEKVVKIPARYSFVCKKEKTGWYILEHHSSEFPG